MFSACVRLCRFVQITLVLPFFKGDLIDRFLLFNFYIKTYSAMTKKKDTTIDENLNDLDEQIKAFLDDNSGYVREGRYVDKGVTYFHSGQSQTGG